MNINEKNNAQLCGLTGTEMEHKEVKTISSREVAEMMEMQHKNLLQKIDEINNSFCTAENSAEVISKYWTEGFYIDVNNRKRRELNITKRGCEFLAHKTTGAKGNIFTDRYMDKFEEMKTIIEEQPMRTRPLSTREMMREQLNMIDEVSERVDKLENTMTIDYGQQKVLERLVATSVITALGGKGSNAYHDMSKKVFSECNHDIQDYFNVNSRCNIPKLKFDDACKYIKAWQPCTNTKITINDCNAQMSM